MPAPSVMEEPPPDPDDEDDEYDFDESATNNSTTNAEPNRRKAKKWARVDTSERLENGIATRTQSSRRSSATNRHAFGLCGCALLIVAIFACAAYFPGIDHVEASLSRLQDSLPWSNHNHRQLHHLFVGPSQQSPPPPPALSPLRSPAHSPYSSPAASLAALPSPSPPPPRPSPSPPLPSPPQSPAPPPAPAPPLDSLTAAPRLEAQLSSTYSTAYAASQCIDGDRQTLCASEMASQPWLSVRIPTATWIDYGNLQSRRRSRLPGPIIAIRGGSAAAAGERTTPCATHVSVPAAAGPSVLHRGGVIAEWVTLRLDWNTAAAARNCRALRLSRDGVAGDGAIAVVPAATSAASATTSSGPAGKAWPSAVHPVTTAPTKARATTRGYALRRAYRRPQAGFAGWRAGN